VIKIDVEGYETEVISGARRLLTDQRLLAIVMELNGSGMKYGYDEQELIESLIAEGFASCTYEPSTRRLAPSPRKALGRRSDNVIFARHLDVLADRLRSAADVDLQDTSW
jgi:hypothetical protein